MRACLVLSEYFAVLLILYFTHAVASTTTAMGGRVPVSGGPTVRKDERWRLVSSEYGEISAVKISDGRNGCYHLHFITLDPHSLLLPVYLYSEMVFYVNSGNGTLSWIDVGKDNYEVQQLELQTGDIYTLQAQTVFYLQNNLEDNDSHELQIYAIYSESENRLSNGQCGEVYAGVHDLVRGFDSKVLQATFSVSKEVIEELKRGEMQPLIVQEHPKTNNSISEVSSRLIRAFLGTKNYDIFDFENKKKKKKDKKKKDKKKAFNIFKADHDVENRYGWSVTVTNKQLDALQESDFSVFMVNLTEGSMLGPHWNPTNAEIMIVLHGQGMVQVVCPNIVSRFMCKNSRFRVEEGDVFMVPRYHPMAQMSFNNKSFIFMGFTTVSENNPSEYLTGKNSILQTLDKSVVAQSFDVKNTTVMDEVLSTKNESIFLECMSCADEEERMMEEEAKREMEGGGGGWQDAEIEGEIARSEEEAMRRRLRKAEAVADEKGGGG